MCKMRYDILSINRGFGRELGAFGLIVGYAVQENAAGSVRILRRCMRFGGGCYPQVDVPAAPEPTSVMAPV